MRSAWLAELWKIATVKGQWISAILATLAIPVVSFLVVSTGGLSPGESTSGGAATGALAGLLAFGVWSATISAGEYAQGTMVTSLSTVPRRLVLFSGKVTATAATAGVGALLSATVALFVVVGVRAPGHYGFGNPALLVGVVVAVITVAVFGVSVGIATRSPSASIVIVVMALLLPKAAGSLLGSLQRWVVGASPSTVVTEIVGGSRVPPNQTFPGGTWAALLTMMLVAVVVALGALVAFIRRDG